MAGNSKKWEKLPKSKGIEYREQDGLRYYRIRYTLNGKPKTEGLGCREEAEVQQIKATLDLNQRTGKGPQTYAEMVGADKAARIVEADRKERGKENTIERISADYLDWLEKYVKSAGKSYDNYKSTKSNHNKWIVPHLGKIPFNELGVDDIEELIEIMREDAKSARTMQIVNRQIGKMWRWHIEQRRRRVEALRGEVDPDKIKEMFQELLSQRYPGELVDTGKVNNKRRAWLTYEQSQQLLEYLDDEKHRDIHDYCVLTLYTGMRPSEIHRLTWHQARTGYIFKTKNGQEKYVYFNLPPIVRVLNRRLEMYPDAHPHDLIFPRSQADKNGNMNTPRNETHDAFGTAVEKLGFYKPIPAPMDEDGNLLPEPPHVKAAREQENRNNKIVFYSLRHTFASWLVQGGAELYKVRDAMGHTDIEMTQRYAHLAPTHIQQIVQILPGVAPQIEAPQALALPAGETEKRA